MMKRRFKNLLLFAAAVCCWQGVAAQHTLGFTAGYGMASMNSTGGMFNNFR